MLPSDVTPGEVIARRFEIERAIGAGGMGTVFRARDLEANKLVAVKRLDIKSKNDQERFVREAAVLAELRHPGIVRYIAHGKSEAGEHYIAMEWLDGMTLQERFASGALSMIETVQLGIRVATALHEAHRRGVVHRDIKPPNLFLVNNEIDRVKVLDFGVARLTGFAATGPTMTRTGALIGTPGYMAPEQARGEKDLDARADVFALGSVMFECLCGKPPFSGANVMAVLAKILLEEAPAVRELRPEVPDQLNALIAAMLSKDPGMRPRHGEEVARALSSLTFGELESGNSYVPTVIDDEPPTKPPALTTNEQRVLCVVLAGQMEGTAKTWTPGETRSHSNELERLVESFEAQLDELMDGSLVVSLTAQGAANDLVARAARCALAVRAHLPDVPVVLATGRGVIAARMPVGEVIDRAARVLARAEPGAIHLDGAAAGLLESTGFDIVSGPRGPMLLGESGGLTTRRTLLGKPTTCVGRERELVTLEALFTECTNEPVARAVLVTGPPGIGKSRVRYELLNRLKARCEEMIVLFARGDALRAGSPFGMIADAILRTAGIAEGEPLEARREKLAARIALHMNEKAQHTAAFLGELAGVPFPDENDEGLRAARGDAMLMGDAMRAAWDDWLEAETNVQPVLLVLEDLHWGDLPTIKLVDAALRNLADHPLMVVALARPELHDQFPNLWAERGLQEIRLGPLTKKAGEKLVKDVLGAAVAEEKLRLVVDRCEGNPFYLEELIRAVAANTESTLPETILGMVQSRLDALGVEAKRVLRASSVFGGTFWRGGVLTLLGGADSTSRVSEWLDELVDREVVAKSPTSKFPGEQEFLFRQALVREAAYAMLTEGDRRLGHRLAGSWLETAGERDVNVLAQHYETGGEHDKAILFLKRAAEQALEASDFHGAIDRVTRAIACGASGEVLGALQLLAGEGCVWLGRPAEAEKHLERAAALLPQGSVQWYRAAAETIASITRQGHADRLEAWVERASTASPVTGAASAQLVCLSRSAENMIVVGKYKLADALAKQIGELMGTAESTLEPLALARVHRFRARRSLHNGDPGAYVDGLLLAQDAFAGAGDMRNATNERMNLGFAFAELGEFVRAEEVLRAAHAVAKKMALRTVIAWADNNLGNVLGLLGRVEEAKETEARAIEAGRSQGDPRLEGNSRIYMSAIQLRAGDLNAALTEARAAVGLTVAIPSLRALALAAEARALLALGRAQDAVDPARDAMRLLEELGALEEGESLVRLAYAEALWAAGATEGAKQSLARARDRLHLRALRIADARFRESFLTAVPENARTLRLAEEWKCDESVTLRD